MRDKAGSRGEPRTETQTAKRSLGSGLRVRVRTQADGNSEVGGSAWRQGPQMTEEEVPKDPEAFLSPGNELNRTGDRGMPRMSETCRRGWGGGCSRDGTRP